MADNRQPHFGAAQGGYYGAARSPVYNNNNAYNNNNMGNMRYGAAFGPGTARMPQQAVPVPPRQTEPVPREIPPARTPPETKENPPSRLLQSLGLDEEKLILLTVTLILVKSGADWPLLAALFYIMM